MSSKSPLVNESILRFGEVVEVSGRKVFVAVDKEKNLSDLIFNGDILKNISVNGYVEIRKGFLSLIGKVDGEKTQEESLSSSWNSYEKRDKNKRILAISLSGFINKQGSFVGGLKEMPLIGNEAYLLTKQKLHVVHNLVSNNSMSVSLAKTDADDFDIEFPVDGLFNSHIAIFGNTGSGKSNTLAYLYQELVKTLRNRNADSFEENSKFVLFDFNGEYSGDDCITREKTVFNLSTGNGPAGNKLPLSAESLMNIEVLSILSDATEKTQKPFIRRALKFYDSVFSSGDPLDYFKNTLRSKITHVLQMCEKDKAFLLVDHFRQILPEVNEHGVNSSIDSDLEWHNTNSHFMRVPGPFRLDTNPADIPNTIIYQRVANYTFDDDLLGRFIHFLYLQLIFDVIANRALNEHIAPAVNKLISKKHDIDKIFDSTGANDLWDKNFIVVNLNNVNLEMKKTVPLLLSKKLYLDHKVTPGKSLTFIIDEAHNILSRESFREAESWKDYRLETFEEIIKEGRKFGVFVTISSQRPSDISSTITSQAHNYFIHRLINQKDLAMISNVVSYIDKVSEESIPVLPTGTCIFSGVASPMPLKLNIKELDRRLQPKSTTLAYSDIIPIPVVV